MPDSLPPYLTTGQLAEYLTGQGVSITEEGVRRWCRDGKIEALRLPGRQWRVTRETAEAILTPAAASKT